jgi:hypothetical protein
MASSSFFRACTVTFGWQVDKGTHSPPTNMVQKSLTSALQELLTFRVRGHRNSVEIVQKGLFVLEHKDGIRKLGDERMDETSGHITFQLTITLHPSMGLPRTACHSCD